MDTDAWEYHFEIESLINRDAKILKLMRYRTVSTGLEQEYLTVDGWEPFAAYATLDVDRMIYMTGLQMTHERGVIERLHRMVEKAVGVPLPLHT